jgi:hypothetical protein
MHLHNYIYMLSVTMFHVIFLLAALALAHGRPVRGSVKWSILLCTTSDGGNPMAPRVRYETYFQKFNTAGAADYWALVSYGALDVGGSVISGW